MQTQSSQALELPRDLRAQHTAVAEELVRSLVVPDGTAIVATGSLARKEMTAHSDLDLILIHQGVSDDDIETLWYPVWDAKKRLDASIRTPDECAKIAAQDAKASLAMLDMRFISGDADLAERTRTQVLRGWRRLLPKTFNDIVATAIERWRRAGSVVTMTRPDLKHGHGGLRDIELIRALALANVISAPDLSAQRQLLLDVRTLLHSEARRQRDILDPEFAASIGLELGYKNRYELAQALSTAGTDVDRALTDALAQAQEVLPKSSLLKKTTRHPLDLDVVDAGGRIELSRNPDLEDPGLLMRVAAAASRTGLPVSESAWRKLEQLPPLFEPWPAATVTDFFVLLSGPHSARVISELDRRGMWSAILPEWESIRGLMPREPIHEHTVDKHLLLTVENCSAARVHVARPDLLVLAALFHDIGKGRPESHSMVGAELIAEFCGKLGFNLRDRSRVQTLVAEHTTLAKLASRQDPRAESTIDALLDALHYDLTSLNLLEELTRADALATSPKAWSSQVQHAVATLAEGARRRLVEVHPDPPMLAVSKPSVEPIKQQIRIEWCGEIGATGVCSLISAKDWTLECAQVLRSVGGATQFSGVARVKYPSAITLQNFEVVLRTGNFPTPEPVEPALTVLVWRGAILEVRTVDRVGVFGALLQLLPPIEWAKMTTPGATMIAQFKLRSGFDRAAVEREVTRALGSG